MEPYQYDLLRYFEEAADHYPADIEPIFSPLADLLVSTAHLQTGDRVLDIGTGTGTAARAAALLGCRVTALDFSHRMTVAAADLHTPSVVQGDFHRLPFAQDAFNTVLAVFALNSSVPLNTMREVRRVLKPGGQFALQEWGTIDPVGDLLSDILMEYAVDEPPPDLARRRREQQMLHPWDELETSDDIVGLMREAGFEEVQVQITTASVRVESTDVFIRYKLAWPIRQAEINAMPEEVRRLCLSDLQENLERYTDSDGRLHWQPNLVQVFGLKPARGGRRTPAPVQWL